MARKAFLRTWLGNIFRQRSPNRKIDADNLSAGQKASLESLRNEITNLQAAIKAAKLELYKFNSAYAPRHFSLQSSMKGNQIEQLRSVGLRSSIAMLERQRSLLLERIALLREESERKKN